MRRNAGKPVVGVSYARHAALRRRLLLRHNLIGLRSAAYIMNFNDEYFSYVSILILIWTTLVIYTSNCEIICIYIVITGEVCTPEYFISTK